MAEPTFFQRYDSATNVVFVTFPHVYLETHEDIQQHFDRVIDFWRTNCGNKKVYYIVNYDGFSVNLRENEFYARQMRRVIEQCAITVVRYGGDSLQRTAARLYSMKLHSPTRLYESFDEAVEVVKALQAGEMKLEAR